MMLQQQTTMDQMDAVKFNNQLLDYDYGSDGEEAKGEGGQTSHQQQMQPVLQFPFNNFTKCLEDPNIIKQLQNIKQMDMQRYLSEMPGASNSMMDPQQSQSSGIKLANINNLRNLPIMVDKQDQDVELVGDIMSAEIIPCKLALTYAQSSQETQEQVPIKRQKSIRSEKKIAIKVP